MYIIIKNILLLFETKYLILRIPQYKFDFA